MNAQVQRTLLWTDFDHVAIIVRTEQLKAENDFIILEAVAPVVRCVRWSNIRKAIIGMQKKGKNTLNSLYYRKVNIDRTKTKHDLLIEFAQQSIGKKYSLTYEKIQRNETTGFTHNIDLT